MRVVLGADAAGMAALEVVRRAVTDHGATRLDLPGPDDGMIDFPDIAQALSLKILNGEAELGIMVCGTGIGAAMAANKVRGIRAAVAHDIHSAHQCVEHDDANVLCLGAQIVGAWVIPELVQAFLSARFANTEDYRRRLEKMARLEHA